MDIDELITQLTKAKKEVGNVEITISSEDGNDVRKLSAVFTDSDIDCRPFIVLE